MRISSSPPFYLKYWLSPRIYLLLAAFYMYISAVGQAPQVLKDINPYLTLSSQTTAGYNYKGYNGYVYFSADNGINGYELWKTDGTEANTVLVKDINTGVSSSSPQSYAEMGGVLFFIATTSANGTELWKTDGTEANTVLVKDINTGTAGSSPANLRVINGVLYFTATTTTSGRELWRSDGTEAGTFLVKDIRTGTSGSNPSAFTQAGSLFYFTADDNLNGEELWVSDGTTAGTFLLKDIYPGFSGPAISYLTPVGNTVFFQAEDDVTGIELWKTDGTPGGTVLVKDIEPGLDGSNPYYLINFNGTLFFTATTIANGTELWKSDGTESGTVLVKDINVLGSGGVPTELTVAGSQLFFNAFTDANGIELWKSDGTTSGTTLVKDINPGTAHGVPSDFIYVNSTLYFTATTTANGKELWKSDGTESGTVLVQDINPGTLSSSPSRFTDVNGTLFFTATQNGQVLLLKTDGTNAGTVPLNSAVVSGGTYASLYGFASKLYFMYDGYKPGIPSTATGREPWVSDGTNAGTMLVKDINMVPNSNAANPGSLLRVGNTVYFAANNGTNGNELWKTDGTEAGTVLLKDIVAGSSSSSPANFANVNGTIFFTASATGFGNELWKTDGTEAGTVLVKDIRTGTSSSTPTLLTASGNLLYFVANDGTTGNELWKSDGTAAGTVLVSDIVAGTGTPAIQNPVNLNGTLIFTAVLPAGTRKLWKSDGTGTGTVMIKDVVVGNAAAAIPDELIAYNGKVYFPANDGLNGIELWATDGTTAGTNLFLNIATSPTFPNSRPHNFAVAEGKLYFSAFTASTQYEPWISDGTPAGTNMLIDIDPGSGGSGPTGFTGMNGMVYFNAGGTTAGRELWKTDGTTAGTVLVKDINPGTANSNPELLTAVNNTLFFRATTASGGVEFFKSDGTEAGTVGYDLFPGTTNSNPDNLTPLNSKLLFTATHPIFGTEVWKVYAAPGSNFTIVGDTTPCVNGTAVYSAIGVVNDSTTYTWSLPLGGGTIISAADTAVVNWTTAANRNVQLVLSNSAGSSAPKQRSLVVSGTAPERIPVIFNFARTLSVDSVLQSASLQWFRNDTIISGATSSSYYAGLAGSYSMKYKNNCGYGPASNVFNFPADTLSQTITFPHTDTIAMAPAAKWALPATASSGLPVFYQKISGPGNVVNDTLFISGVGTIIIKALQPGDDVYSPAAPMYDTIIVKKGSQLISFDSIPPKIYPATAFPLTANSSVGLPVSFSVISGPASVANGNLTILGAGLITVRATQNGDSNYNAATPVDRTFCVGIRTLTNITGITSPCFATYQYTTQKITGANYVWTLSGGGILTTSNDTAWVQWQTAGTHTLNVKANSPCDPQYTNELQLSITTSNNTIIGPVTGMLPADGITDQQLPLRLSWIPGINTVNYDLYIWDSAAAEPLTPYVPNIAAISYTIPKNAPFPYDKTYKWRVVSKNPCAQIPGPVQTFRLIPLPDLVISDVQAPATATSGQTITVSWKVTNIGPGKTLLNQSWEDGVYFALDTVPNVNLGNPFPFPTAWSQLTAAGRPLLLGKKNRPAALESGQFYTNSIDFTLPLGYNFPVYVYGIAANNGALYRLLQVSNLNDTARAPNQIVITQPPVPDLRVDSVFTPASIFSGSTLNVTYKVKNYGVVTPAGGTWVDSFFISQNPLFDRNQCIPLNVPKQNGSYYPNAAGAAAYNNVQLNADSSITKNQQVVIPNFIFGTWFIYVKTNAGTTTGSYIYEGALNNNNVNQALLQIYLTPTPKLTVNSVTVPVTTASTTQPIGVNWNIKNDGFRDNIEKNRGHYLTMSTCNVPCSPPRQNCVATVASVIKDSVVFGSSYWVDRVYLSTDAAGLNIANAVLVKEVKHGTENSGVYTDAPAPTYSFVSCPALAGGNINVSNVIQPAANFPKAENFTIPSNLPAGNYYVYVYTNPTKKVFEYPGTPQIKRSDLPIVIQRPDAIVSSISCPSSASGGQTIQVNYDVLNNGPGTVFNHLRKDRLYISNNPIFDGSAVVIASQTFTESLPVGTAVTHSFSYSIPPATSGTKYFYVVTNYDSLFKETNQTNNTSAAAAIAISAAPPADLIVSSVLPQDSVLIQSPALFKYTVVNNGTGPTIGNWTDSIFISCSPVFNAATAKFVARRTQTRVVTSGGSYTDSFALVIPQMSYEINNCFPQQLYAQGYFYVKANADSGAYEGAALNNNTNGSGSRVVINPLVDHVLVAASINRDTVSLGTAFSASWKVKNTGYKPTEAYYSSYFDGIYFSPDSLVNANDILAFGFRNYNTINRNDSLVTVKSVMPPDIPAGDYYVIAKTNYGDHIPAEKIFGNNHEFIRDMSGQAKKIHLVRPPLPDLTDTILSATASVAMGQPFTVIYKVTNIGSVATFPGAWKNALYLSADFQLQVGDRLISGKTRTTPLAPGASFIDTVTCTMPVNIAPGNYVLIAKANSNYAVPESNASNNLGFGIIEAQLPDSTDLVVENVMRPDTVYLGYTIDTAKWVVKNNSAVRVRGWVTDGLYLSASNLLDSTAALLGTKKRYIDLLPMEKDTLQLTPLVTTATEGNYNLFAQTDLLNNIIELDKTNNTGVAATAIYVKAKELKLGIPELNTLQTINRYYKLRIPDSLQRATILVTLKTNDSLLVRNEMYIGGEFVPTPANYDYRFETPNYGNQQIVLSDVSDSVYYIMYRCVSANPPVQNITLRADVLPFAILNVQTNSGGNIGNVTVRIRGSLFRDSMIAKLSNGTTTIYASAVYYTNNTQVFATFPLQGKPTGIYDLTLIKPDSSTAILTNGFSIVTANNGGLITGGGPNTGPGNGNAPGCDPGAASGLNSQLVVELIVPEKVVRGRPVVIVINFNNPTNFDLPVQTRILYNDEEVKMAFTKAGIPNGTSSLYIEFAEPGGPPGILRPGGGGSIIIHCFAPPQVPEDRSVLFKLQ
jgi:ELWxxDGT repeat protein